MTYACEVNVRPGTLKCSTPHCTSFQGTFDEVAYCKCLDYKGNKIPGCEPKDNAVPVITQTCYNKVTGEQRNISDDDCQALRDKDKNWSWKNCYCCCSCFAWYTKIKIPDDQVRFVQQIEVTDSVMAGYIDLSGGGLAVSWKATEVSFSDGTSPGANPQEMIAIQYGEDGEIIATPDQPFLLPDGKLKAANRLTPLDQLVDEEGNAVDIESIRLIKYTGGIHHLGLGAVPPDVDVPINGHLLSAEGLICGDFWLQVTYPSQGDSAALVKGHSELPMIGSPDYSKQKGFSADLFSATRKGARPRAIRNPFCEEQEAIKEVRVPSYARWYLTKKQADDINKNPDDFYPISIEANVPDFRWTKRVFACMYPDVNIYLEWADEMPNLYAFEQYGQKTVYISGRLLRAKGVYREGIAMMLAYGVALFYADSEDPSGSKVCTGLADYFGAGYIMRQAFTFNWSEMSTEGYRQIRALFGKIKKPNRGGDPNNKCLLPSIDCRLECINNALSGKAPPHCSGVPVPGRLRLQSAQASVAKSRQSVVAVFNEPVDLNSSQVITNYTIMPETVITTAVRDKRDPSKVVLTVTLPKPPEGEYKLSVSDIISDDGSTLNPNGRTAGFSIPPA